MSAIRIAVQLEEARDTARRLFGPDYEGRVGRWRAKVRECCEVWDCRPIEIPPTMERAGCLPENPLLLFAAIVEEITNTTTNQQEETMPSTKTKKGTKPKDIKGQTKLPESADPEVQSADKMKKIRAQRLVVKKHELEIGRLREETKIAREEREGALSELYRLIDGSGQGEFFVSQEASYLDKKTGEIETSDSEEGDDHDDTKVTLSSGNGKSATTTLGGLKRATEKLASTS